MEVQPPLQLGRYVLFDEIASGGMAKIHLGRASGALGFSKFVAIKRILPHLIAEQDFVDMFVDETHVAARIQHPNVVSTLDVVTTESEVFLVMEFILGESFARLLRACRKLNHAVPLDITVAIVGGMLRGLHAAHEARNDMGELLGVVHRDVSPQNLLVGADGLSRVIDFGVAKAYGQLQMTRDGRIKGKLSYMAPEQLTGVEPDRRTDVYAAGVILWEALAGTRLHTGDNDAIVYSKVLQGDVQRPSAIAPHVPPALDAVVMRALERDARMRYATAEEFALALERIVQPASLSAVSQWVRYYGAEGIQAKAARIAEIERGTPAPPSSRPLLVVESASSHSVVFGPASIRSGGDLSGGYGRSAIAERIEPAQDQRPIRVFAGVTLTLAAVGLVLGGIAIAGGLHRKPAASAASSSAEPPPAPSPSSIASSSVAEPPPPTVGSLPSASPLSPEPSRKPAEPAAPPTSVTASASGAPSASVARASTPMAKPHVLVAPPPPTARSCNPPWVIDATGIKRFRPECM